MECPPTAHVAGPDFSDVVMRRPPGAARLRPQGGPIAEGAGGAHRGRIQEHVRPGLRLKGEIHLPLPSARTGELLEPPARVAGLDE